MAGIQQAVDRMDSLMADWEAQRDNRAVFVCSYRAITARLKQAVDDAEFEDNEWMEALDVQFAQEYFDAVEAWESGEGHLPECWRLAFELSERGRTTVTQDLLLGMNAHISHDLAIALAKVGIGSAERESRKRDHDRVNELLAAMIDTVQDEVARRYSAILRLLDGIIGRDDEKLTDGGIRAARADAWACAVELVDASDAAESERLRRRLEERASEAAGLLGVAPSRFVRLWQPVRRWDRRLASYLRRG